MLCPSCHTHNRDNAKFCKGCGMSFPPENVETSPPEALGPSAGPEGRPQGSPDGARLSLVDASTSPAETPGVSDIATVVSSPPTERPATTAVEQAPSPKSEDAHEVEDADDLSLIPTQILTPEQMMAYHARRWQQEVEREQRQAGQTPSATDIADQPTMLFSPVGTASTAPTERADIWSQPTVIMAPPIVDPESHAPVVQDAPAASPLESSSVEAASAPSTFSTETAKVASEKEASIETATETGGAGDKSVGLPPLSGPADSAANTNNAMATEASSPKEEVASPPPQEEEEMEQGTPREGTTDSVGDQQQHGEQQEGATTDFPVLAVGATVAGRYEVAQVISEAVDEHIYQIVDHQGYQHCWNCGSEQNAEGDEFCIDCGAELLNAPYTMHEYPASASANADSHVIPGTIMNTLVDQGKTYVIEQPQAVQIAFPTGVHLLASSDSDAGTVRRSEPNEDSTLVLFIERVHESMASPFGMFVVADGMGGHDAGQVASRMTVNTIAERVTRELFMAPLASEKAGEQPKAMDEDALVELVHGSIQDANTVICQTNQHDKTDMGSTLTGFMMAGDLAYIFNVGDSRTYMLRDANLYQLTTDHSLVGQLVAGGLIEPDDVYTHPQRSQIYRSIGDKLNVQIDIFKQQVHPGDILLSCSDGLWEMVRNPQIADILNRAPDPQTACTHLIEAANTNGGEDNVSAVVVFVR